MSFRRISVAMRSGIAQRWVLLVKCLGRAPVVTLQGGSNDELISGRRIFNQPGKKVAVAIAVLSVFGLVLWGGIEMALRLMSGR